MKTKTTLAALLLAAVMVTPSYGGEYAFWFGAREFVSDPESYKDTPTPFDATHTEVGYFKGMVKGVVLAKDLSFPKGTSYTQIMKAVAYYIDLHQDEPKEPVAVILRAIKREWPDSNKHVAIPE